MPTEIRLTGGNTISVAQGDKLVAKQLNDAAATPNGFARLTTTGSERIWVNPNHVLGFEEHPTAVAGGLAP